MPQQNCIVLHVYLVCRTDRWLHSQARQLIFLNAQEEATINMIVTNITSDLDVIDDQNPFWGINQISIATTNHKLCPKNNI